MRAVRVPAAVIVAIGAVLFAAPAGSAEEPKPRVAEEALSDRVAALERKVKRLERENALLKEALARNLRARSRLRVDDAVVVPTVPLPGNRVPEHWVPREFDGIRFYIIPLSHGN